MDANNLYGWGISQYLPYTWFKWLNKKEIDKCDVNSVGENSSGGYILEVDFEYPDELHKLHNDYYLEISQKILPNYCSSIANEYRIKIGVVKKLIPNGSNKSKYFLHYRNLQLYLTLGMKLVKVHRILKFKQSNWFKKKHIDFKYRQKKTCCQ